MMYCYNIFDALSARLDTILDEYLHSRKRKFTLLCNRKELQNIKKEFIIAETELAKYANNIRKTKDKLHDFEDKIPRDIDLKLNINNLQTRREVLQWYIELNSEGTIHTDAEIDRVKELLRKEGE